MKFKQKKIKLGLFKRFYYLLIINFDNKYSFNRMNILFMSGFLECSKIQSKNSLNYFSLQSKGFVRLAFDKESPQIKFIILSKIENQRLRSESIKIEVFLKFRVLF